MKRFIAAIVLMLGLTVGVLCPATTYAIDLFPTCGTNLTAEQCALVKQNELDKNKPNNAIWRIVQVILGALGGVAVIMIVIGGIKYTISRGDSAALTSAKQTILYAVVGLVVALTASAIVLLINSYFG